MKILFKALQFLFSIFIVNLLPGVSFAETVDENIPIHTTISAKLGNFLTPHNDTYYTLISVSSLRPYTLFRSKPAHEKIRSNYELAIGYADGKQHGAIISANMLAQRYLTSRSSGGFRPFVEAGIGLIYTEFRIPGQGLYLNFNPQVGIGFERFTKKNKRHFASLRFSHISNGELDDQNKGINSIALSFGHDF
ncbi:MAG: acyloxyacyl hydrolase [Gammaproteobacteria bacterium]|nr:acyloxyacyl hydrolase [Gammaproteobacteria bacterium]MDH5592794.1 acyloxyacyl hydrolase [Gammaproteobacteria bacterium]